MNFARVSFGMAKTTRNWCNIWPRAIGQCRQNASGTACCYKGVASDSPPDSGLCSFASPVRFELNLATVLEDFPWPG
jgi:hypothetical protein